MDKALELGEKYHIYRTIADEGILMFKLLQDYQKTRGSTPFLSKVISMTRHVSILYPNYLNISREEDTTFTEMEKDILRLLEQGKTYDEIAEVFFISVNTVRYHIKKIYPKLGVSSASQAIFKAKKIGLI
ncbi:MAG: helix-turn-helix transcriptional regulator [Treponema sp.]|nr:helix-turn-helix transcriptional regulator [Treponema sp.]